ncbi:MAG: DUF1887 family protein [Firmicutes bacterium]|nr:DUF1887 family protein [Bacillota bacterium]
MVQIDFFDKDIVSTLLPVITLEPDKVCFLIDKRNLTWRDSQNVSDAISKRLPGTEVEFYPVTVDDLSDIRENLERLIDAYGEDVEYIDLTGGSELMSACGYKAAQDHNIKAIYIDVKRENALDVESGQVIKKVNHLTLDDCLTAIGAKRLRESRELPPEEEFDDVIAVCEVIFDNMPDWQKLCQHIANRVSQTNGMEVEVPINISKTKKGLSAIEDAFEDYGFWTRIDNNENGSERVYRFTDKRRRGYITTFGIWLEFYIYIKALEVYDEAEVGVVIDWYEGDNVDTEDNEIDVMVMKRSVPIFISCKMRKPVSGDLYEVGFMASRLAGASAKGIIATTYPVKEYGTSPKRMYQRMKKLKIGLIEAESFRTNAPAEVFNYAIQMTD